MGCAPDCGVRMDAKEGKVPSVGAGVGESDEALGPEFTEQEAVRQVSRIYRMPCLAYIKFSTNGSY